LLDCADADGRPCRLVAGRGSRGKFAQLVTERIEAHPLITLVHEEVTAFPDGPTIIARAADLAGAGGQHRRADGRDYLYFYDAVSPIVQAETMDMSIAFRQSRYDREGSASLQAQEQEEGDYINCPMTREEYEAFVDALLSAETIVLKQFEREDPHFFEGCMPIEAMARRGREALAFGPMRPVGLIDPRMGSGRMPSSSCARTTSSARSTTSLASRPT
jgi:methylenetetrahydrofolate--tRNA-(uracil-5-)-methyltransferase